MTLPLALAALPPQKNVGAAARPMGSSQTRGCRFLGANPWLARVAGDPLLLQIGDGDTHVFLSDPGPHRILPRTKPFDFLPSEDCCGYTRGMKTAVSIPDEVFAQAEKLARHSKMSRSQLFSDALREYVARHASDEVTESMNRVADELGTSDSDFAVAGARRLLERSEW